MIWIRLFFISHFVLFSNLAFAQGTKKSSSPLERFTINNADSMERDFDKGAVFLSGNVRIGINDKKISSDRIEIWYKSKQLYAIGNSLIESEGFQIAGERIEYNYDTNLGTIYDGSVKSGKVIFEGKKIEKIGENDFRAEEGKYTACDCTPRAWSFSGKDIDAEMGGYAKLKWPVLRILNVPVFGLPYIIVPLKSTRQSGLLLPVHEYTRDGGTALAESFFWAIAQDKDATATLKNYDRRGLKYLGNFRYRPAVNSALEIDGAYVNDKVFPYSTRLQESDLGKDFDRWFIKYRHHYELPMGYTHRAQITSMSDLQYLSDFSAEIEEPGNAALENRISLTKKSEQFYAGIETAYYTNLLKTNPKAGNEDAVHRLPEIQYSLIQKPFGQSNLQLKIDAKYTNFARNYYAHDDVTRTAGINPETNEPYPPYVKTSPDGIYQPYGNALDANSLDLIRTGQRLDIQPSMSYVFFPGDILEVSPTLLYRSTQYYFGIEGENSAQAVQRSYWQGLVTARTRLGRVYEGSENKFKHEISPEITWSNIPYLNQPLHPFFRSSHTLPNFKRYQPLSDEDFTKSTSNGVQFDYYDRVLDKNLITLGISNKLIRKENTTPEPQYTQVGTFRIYQTYDLVEASKRAHEASVRPWSEVTALLDLRFDRFETNSVFQYYPYHNTTNTSSRIRFKSQLGSYLEFTYIQTFIIPETGNVSFADRDETLSSRLGFQTKYFDLSGGTDYSLVNHDITSWSTLLTLKPPGNCVVFVVAIDQPLNQSPRLSSKINFSFDGI